MDVNEMRGKLCGLTEDAPAAVLQIYAAGVVKVGGVFKTVVAIWEMEREGERERVVGKRINGWEE